jgi:5-methylcytosine-specific restriction endonuclease McrA
VCRKIGRQRALKKYDKSEKGVEAEKRWKINPKKKEIDKKSRSRPEARANAVRRITLYKLQSPYAREQTKRLNILYAKTRRKSRYKISEYSVWWEAESKKGCARCGSYKVLCIDHIEPRIRGGSDEIKNLQILCRECNGKKLKEDLYANNLH